jgi:hypothetical protein
MDGTSFLKELNNMYSSNTYLEKNGTNLITTFVIILTVFTIITYVEIQTRIKPMQENWDEYRCNPTIMPIAGLINAPKDKGVFEYTAENFGYCVNIILSDIMSYVVSPFEVAVSALGGSLGGFGSGGGGLVDSVIKEVSVFISKLRDLISGIVNDLYAKAYNTLISGLPLFMKVQDAFNRTGGVFISSVYMLETASQTLIGFLNLAIQFVSDWLEWLMHIFGGILIGVFVVAFFVFFGELAALGIYVIGRLVAESGFSLLEDHNWFADIVGGILVVVGEAVEVAAFAILIATIGAAWPYILVVVGILAVLTVIVLILLDSIWMPIKGLVSLDPSHIDMPVNTGWIVGVNDYILALESFFPQVGKTKFTDVNTNLRAASKAQAKAQAQNQEGFTCFDRDTKIRMHDGSLKPISKITTDDVLMGKNKVTAVFVGMNLNVRMYNLHGTVVSGSHHVLREGAYIPVSEHPESVPVDYSDSTLYCLNTGNKTLSTQRDLYLDWDELVPDDIDKLTSLLGEKDVSAIDRELSGGFVGNTRIMIDGKYKLVEDVRLGDRTGPHASVIGIFKIKAAVPRVVAMCGKTFTCGPMVIAQGSHLGDVCSKDVPGSVESTHDGDLYHLLTSDGTMIIEGVKFHDYRAALDKLL